MAVDLSPYPWQQAQWQRLQMQRRAGKLPHALLLTGQQGLGLNHFAHLFMQSLICQVPDSHGQPCGSCAPCRQFQQGVYPDLMQLSLQKDKAHILVDQVRALSEFLSLTHSRDAYKLALISPADRMNINAANSLLKTLEEPPGDTLLILVASTVSLLPATIKSRCQRIQFNRPEAQVARAWLQTQVQDQIEERLLLAAGAPCLAATLDAGLLEQYTASVACLLKVLRGEATLLECRSLKPQPTSEQVLNWAQSLVRDLIRVHGGYPHADFENHFHISELRHLAVLLDSKQLHQVNERFTYLRGMVDHPLNADLQRDEILATWYSIRPHA